MRAFVERWRFYLYHSLRSLWRERQRTAFALFCVVVGVASIVGLQTLGFLVADALTGNVRASNRGDVALVQSGDDFFSQEQMAAFERLVSDGLATDVTYRYRTQDFSVAVERGQGAGQGLILDSFLVDPSVYPFYGVIRAIDPADVPLRDLLADPHDVVVGKSLADRHGVAVGDHLQIGALGERYLVRGIVPSGSSVPGQNVSPLLLGFIYLDYEEAVETLDLERTATEAFFVTENPDQAIAVAARLTEIAPGAQPRTAEELLGQNEETSRVINRLVLVVGLLALLIGGLGIANTMLVAVVRRTPEIAVLKALGLKGRQVTLLFLTEAALLGLAGGLMGLPLGLAVSRGMLGLAALFFPTPIVWHPHPLPLVTGVAVAVTATTVCGFLPALAAAHTRPMQVLRPDGAARPRAGRWRSLVAVLGLTAVIGVLAGQLLGSVLAGLVGAYVTLVLLGVLIGLLWTVVWGIEKLPSLRWASLRLALRGIGRNRGRAASTLLALIIGLFAISLITILTSSVLDTLATLTSGTIGADLIIVTPAEEAAAAPVLRALQRQPGVISHVEAAGFPAQLIAINGDSQAYEQRIATYEAEQGGPLAREQRQALDGYFTYLAGRGLSSNRPRLDFAPGMGRNLTADDVGRRVALLPGSSTLAPLGLVPGDTLTFRLDDTESAAGKVSDAADAVVTLEIVGVSRETLGTVTLGGDIIVPHDVLASLVEPDQSFYLVDVDRQKRDEIVTALVHELPAEAVVLETDVLVGLLAELAQQVAILPMLVAGLALFAAATMIANTTALATMERRREIGVMKAVGIKADQILGQLLLESGILGFVGGLIGVGLVVLAVMLLSAALAEFSARFSPWTILSLMFLAVGLTLVATVIAAWPASRRKPLNVLRYE
jgi:putative ABC transport system permease protein